MKSPLSADRPLGFAQAASRRINGALVRCEERFPGAGAHSVLYVVVDREAAQWRERLAGLHQEYFSDLDPAAPVRLEVVDRATDEALQRLIDAGLVARTTRATRPLLPMEPGALPPPLSDAERARAAAQRTLAFRKLQVARMLGDGGFAEEARPALLEAAHAFARVLAMEQRLPEPATLEDALLPPLSHLLGEMASVARDFVADSAAPTKRLTDALGRRLGG